MDIRPVSDPSSVTKMQQMAKAQFVLSTLPQLAEAGGDVRVALYRAYEASGIEDIEELLPEPKPDPVQAMAAQLEMQNKQADTEEKKAKAVKAMAEAQAVPTKAGNDAGKLELEREKVNLAAVQAGMASNEQ